MANTEQERGGSAPSQGPAAGSAPHPGAPSDGADPASNEASDSDAGGTGDYADALKKIEGEPRPQS